MVLQEAARALVTLSTVRTQLDVIMPYFLHYANNKQRQRWFPGLAAGTLLTVVDDRNPARIPISAASVGHTETFRCGVMTRPSVAADLIPAS